MHERVGDFRTSERAPDLFYSYLPLSIPVSYLRGDGAACYGGANRL